MRKRPTYLRNQITSGIKGNETYTLLVLLLILVFSYFATPLGDYMLFRSLRVGVSGLVLLYFLVLKRKQTRILLFLSFYTLSSLTIIWFEKVIFGKVSMALAGFAFLALIYELSKAIEFRSIGKVFYTVLILGSILYATLLVELIKMLSIFIADDLLKLLVILTTSLSFILGILVLCYNHVVNTSKSLLFTFFYIFLVFAEIFRAIAYYGFVDKIQGQYMARTLLVVGFGFFIFYLRKSDPNDIPMTKIKSSGRI